MTAVALAGGLKHATGDQSVMTAGALAGGLNHATSDQSVMTAESLKVSITTLQQPGIHPAAA
jgi:hypothetical protein